MSALAATARWNAQRAEKSPERCQMGPHEPREDRGAVKRKSRQARGEVEKEETLLLLTRQRRNA